jgi:hypothetical protein
MSILLDADKRTIACSTLSHAKSSFDLALSGENLVFPGQMRPGVVPFDTQKLGQIRSGICGIPPL